MLNNLKQTIESLRNSWRSNDDEINMVIFQTIIDFCEQHNDLGHANVKIKHEILSGDVRLSGLCSSSCYSSDIQISMKYTEFVEAIDNGCTDEDLTEMLTILVHEYRHSYQYLNRLDMIFVRYTEAGEDLDAYYAHPTEVDAYEWQEKLAEETIAYVVANLTENFKSGHEFNGSYHTSFKVKQEEEEQTYDDWEYEMMYEDLYE